MVYIADFSLTDNLEASFSYFIPLIIYKLILGFDIHIPSVKSNKD